MTPHDYLVQVLRGQDLTEVQVRELRNARDGVERCLRAEYGSEPRFYYAGSYGKGTMIADAYDLDVVIYFPSTESRTLSELFWGVNRRLTDSGHRVVPRTVALRLPYLGPFHVDVVPGKAQNHTFRYATLFRNVTPASSLQTSLKVHIEAVKDAGLSDIVRLMKLWKLRHSITLSTFATEIAVGRAMYCVRRGDLASSMSNVFRWMADELVDARLEDPANSNNVVEASMSERITVASAAQRALDANGWSQVIW